MCQQPQFGISSPDLFSGLQMDIIDANRPSHRYPKCCSWTVGHLGEKHHIHPHFQVRNPTCPWHFPPPHPYLSPLPPLHQPLPNAGDGAPEPSQDPHPHLPSSPSCLLHTPPPLTSIITPSLSSMHGSHSASPLWPEWALQS